MFLSPEIVTVDMSGCVDEWLFTWCGLMSSDTREVNLAWWCDRMIVVCSVDKLVVPGPTRSVPGFAPQTHTPLSDLLSLATDLFSQLLPL